MTITEMLNDWNDPHGARTMSDAEKLIDALQIELAGKESVIKGKENIIKTLHEALMNISEKAKESQK